ncbi:MAG: primosomal protein N' [Gammaproteobacteria bacterium]|nr:MAG: primosomal protein N' [Gammaproteobacteria bacterium]
MRQLFTYKVPLNLQTPSIKLGERVVVPFAGRQLVAVVITMSVCCEFDENKVKAITSRQQDEYIFTDSQLNFLHQCAHYYHHPIGDVISQALPVLLRQVESVDIKKVKLWQACVENNTDESDEPSLVDTLALLSKRSPKQAQLYKIIQQHQGITWAELRILGFTKTPLNALVDKNLIVAKAVQPQAFTWHDKQLNQDNKLALTVEQALVVSSVTQKLNAFSCHLLEGITGSGKTEVYLQIIEAVLAQSKQVLVLVPEIGLTPQTLSRFEQRFNLPIFLHHSGLNNNERLQTWLAAKQGSAAIIIGTRSAIFSPLINAGMIIVDEEHDSSLKQQDGFRYHGRDIAILRARQHNIPIVLGSATPSLESFHNALMGKYHHHQLLKRPGKSVEAKIELIDMAVQQVEQGLSASLIDEITQTLARGEQVLIFLNRRGFAPAVSCQECHDIIHCLRCNKPYTLHQEQRLLICHHCGSQKRVPKQCGQCGSVRLLPLGQGTEQLEQRLAEMFSDYSAVRIDRDSTRRKGELAKLLQQVSDKKHQLLIGTQMLAKGHHFPDVTLVAVLDVDGALFSYDFRAAEQMAQLLTQVGGRAGRASKPGKVLVQTHYPQHPLLQDLVNNGYHHFAVQALTERKLAHLPPYYYQTLFRAEANYPSYPDKFLRALTAQPLNGCEFAGPIPAAMEKKAGKYRFHLIVQAKQRRDLHKGIKQLLANIKQNPWHNKVRWSLDIDPQDLSW